MDRTGRFAAVTNYRQGQREASAIRSRGHLVSDYLMGRMSPRAHMARVERDAEQYNGFNLIAGDAEEVVYFSNREGVTRVLAPGVYGLSNHLLDTPWPKVTAGKVALGELVREAAAPRLMAELFALLSDRTRPTDDLLPETGIGREWERLLSSAFIASPDYGTRSSTVILVSRDGRTAFVERRFGADGAPAGEARFELAPAAHSPGAPKPSSA
jgi:uncharacterized protein with NRDE domain